MPSGRWPTGSCSVGGPPPTTRPSWTSVRRSARRAGPQCPSCAFRQNCSAFAAGTVAELPVKSKKLKRRRRHLEYLHVVAPGGQTLVRRRGGGDIWEGLYDLPAVEVDAPRGPTRHGRRGARVRGGGVARVGARAGVRLRDRRPSRTQLTHQELVIRYWRYGVAAGFGESPTGLALADGLRWVSGAELAGLGRTPTAQALPFGWRHGGALVTTRYGK